MPGHTEMISSIFHILIYEFYECAGIHLIY